MCSIQENNKYIMENEETQLDGHQNDTSMTPKLSGDDSSINEFSGDIIPVSKLMECKVQMKKTTQKETDWMNAVYKMRDLGILAYR